VCGDAQPGGRKKAAEKRKKKKQHPKSAKKQVRLPGTAAVQAYGVSDSMIERLRCVLELTMLTSCNAGWLCLLQNLRGDRSGCWP